MKRFLAEMLHGRLVCMGMVDTEAYTGRIIKISGGIVVLSRDSIRFALAIDKIVTIHEIVEDHRRAAVLTDEQWQKTFEKAYGEAAQGSPAAETAMPREEATEDLIKALDRNMAAVDRLTDWLKDSASMRSGFAPDGPVTPLKPDSYITEDGLITTAAWEKPDRPRS